MISGRANPSGKLVQPLVAKGQFAWDMTSPLVLELLPAGHAPGIYDVMQTYFLRVVPAAVNLLTSLVWSQPRFGATNLDINFNSIVGTPNLSALRVIESDGTAAMTLTLTPSSLSGTASLEIACLAQRDALPAV